MLAALQTKIDAVKASRAWARTQQAMAAAKRWGQRVLLLGKRALIATLTLVEKPLLSHAGRERVQATAVFTLIFAFLVTSVDFLVTGGPELGPGASAATYAPYNSPIAAVSSAAAEAELTVHEDAAPAALELAALPAVTAAPPPALTADTHLDLSGSDDGDTKAPPTPVEAAAPGKDKPATATL